MFCAHPDTMCMLSELRWQGCPVLAAQLLRIGIIGRWFFPVLGYGQNCNAGPPQKFIRGTKRFRLRSQPDEMPLRLTPASKSNRRQRVRFTFIVNNSCGQSNTRDVHGQNGVVQDVEEKSMFHESDYATESYLGLAHRAKS
jgi:hypothetical protein